MIKRITGIIAIALLLVSCGTTTGDKEAGNDTAALNVEFTGLIENPAGYLNEDITIEGSVVHVCEHTGKKMFIVGENPDIRLFISAGDEVPVFPMELLGSKISVTGHLAMVAGAEMSGEGNGSGEHPEVMETVVNAEGEVCETEAAVASQPVLANYVLEYRSHVEK